MFKSHSRKIIEPLTDDIITYENFKFILKSIQGTYGHSILNKRDEETNFVSKILSLFNRKPRLFNEAIYYEELVHEELDLYRPENITFYDECPTNKYTNAYLLLCIDKKLELRHCSKTDTQPEKEEIVKDKHTITKVRESFKILLEKVIYHTVKRDIEIAEKIKLISEKINFDKPIKIFSELGYLPSDSVSTKAFVDEIINNELLYEDNLRFSLKKLCKLFYLHISNTGRQGNGKCILCDHEFLDPSPEYISFLYEFGAITKGELIFTDAQLSLDKDGYEQLNFKVNGVAKMWRLEKPEHIASDFFNRFSSFTKEFKTNGKYTYYSDGGQAFVVDYATDEEQEIFITKTKIKRTWLE